MITQKLIGNEWWPVSAPQVEIDVEVRHEFQLAQAYLALLDPLRSDDEAVAALLELRR